MRAIYLFSKNRPGARKRARILSDTLKINKLASFAANLRQFKVYPWRCLCVGSEQITRTTPLRRTTRQFRHNFFTDALTFMLPLLSGAAPA
jgi:hypothetical protein